MSQENADQEQAPTRTRGDKAEKAEKTDTSSTAKINLKYPIEIGGVKTGVVTMRRPKVRDRLAIEEVGLTDFQRESKLVGNLCGLTPEEVEDIDFSDFLKLQKQVAAFVGAPSPI